MVAATLNGDHKNKESETLSQAEETRRERSAWEGYHAQGEVIVWAMRDKFLRGQFLEALAPDDIYNDIDKSLAAHVFEQGHNFTFAKARDKMSDSEVKRVMQIDAEDVLTKPDIAEYRESLTHVKAYSAARKVLMAAVKINANTKKMIEKKNTTAEEIEKIAADGINQIREGVEGATKKHVKPAGEFAKDALGTLNLILSGDSFAGRIQTHIAPLDSVMMGMRRGELVGIGGPAGSGKTSLAGQIARNVSLNIKAQGRDARVLFFSAEMGGESLVTRLAHTFCGVSEEDVRRNYKKPAFKPKVEKYRSTLTSIVEGRTPILIDDSSAPTTTDMLNRALAHRALHKDGIDLIVFDYVKLAGDRGDGTANRIENIWRGLKTLAKETDAAVIAISEITKDIFARPDRTPILQDLKFGGHYECYQALFVDRPTAYATELKDSEGKLIGYEFQTEQVEDRHNALKQVGANCVISVKKNRGGDTGNAKLFFNAPMTVFEEPKEVYTVNADDII